MNTPLDAIVSRTRWLAYLFGAACIGVIALADAQSTPLIITSPANATAVTPGQSLPVTVTVAAGSGLSAVAILGQDPLGAAGPLAGSPVTLYLTIPTTTSPGTYSITAAAVNASGVLVTSLPVTVDVEPTETAAAILVQPTSVNLRFVGDVLPLSVIGTLTGGLQSDLRGSSQLVTTSENTSVATVQGALITATGAGQTRIDVQYGANLVKVLVTVPASIRGDLNGDGKVDKSDLNIITSALNTLATGPNDARDLNHDGVINALDARILVTLCTKPGCATQ